MAALTFVHVQIFQLEKKNHSWPHSLQVNMAKTESLIQYVDNFYSLNKDLFFVAQSLFSHIGVTQTH